MTARLFITQLLGLLLIVVGMVLAVEAVLRENLPLLLAVFVGASLLALAIRAFQPRRIT